MGCVGFWYSSIQVEWKYFVKEKYEMNSVFFLILFAVIVLCSWNQIYRDMKGSSCSSYISKNRKEWFVRIHGDYTGKYQSSISHVIDEESQNLLLVTYVSSPDGGNHYNITYYNCETGEISKKVPIPSMAGTNMLISKDGQLIFAEGGSNLVSMDIKTGKQTWKYESVIYGTVETALANEDKDGSNSVVLISGFTKEAVFTKRLRAVEYGTFKTLWDLSPLSDHSGNGYPFLTVETVEGEDDFVYHFNYTSLLQINARTGEITKTVDFPLTCGIGCSFQKLLIAPKLDILVVTGEYGIFGVKKSTFEIVWKNESQNNLCVTSVLSDSGEYFMHVCSGYGGYRFIARSTVSGKVVVNFPIKGSCGPNVGYFGKTLMGLKATKEEDIRAVVACSTSYYSGTALWQLVEGDKVTKTRVIDETLPDMFIADSSDCVYFSSSYYSGTIQKICL